ncbi:hypothetical protein PENTCL1PPCAC_8550, partial [Pristionchus entomophagus]
MARLDNPGIIKYHFTWIEKPPVGCQHEVDARMIGEIEINEREMNDSEPLRRMQSEKRNQFFNYKADCAFIYIQMQLCSYSLTKWLGDNMSVDSRPIPRIMSWFNELVKGVEYIHWKNRIHRDLKPCNIFFNEEHCLKVADLGLAIEREIIDGVEIPVAQDTWRSRVHMSPEQTFDFLKLNSKSDVFTLGLILAELRKILNRDEKIQLFDNYRRGNQINIFGND